MQRRRPNCLAPVLLAHAASRLRVGSLSVEPSQTVAWRGSEHYHSFTLLDHVNAIRLLQRYNLTYNHDRVVVTLFLQLILRIQARGHAR